jgi:endonuclease YncB( thermonuclease family)
MAAGNRHVTRGFIFNCCFSKKTQDFLEISYKNTIPFVPPIDGGKVIKVYDGDTITIAAKLPYKDSPIYRFSIRLSGIDSPEIKGKTPNEKLLAIKARDALSDVIMNKIVYLEIVGREKYGRLLADVYYDGKNMNKWMIENKYSVSYDGGTKIRPNEWGE